MFLPIFILIFFITAFITLMFDMFSFFRRKSNKDEPEKKEKNTNKITTEKGKPKIEVEKVNKVEENKNEGNKINNEEEKRQENLKEVNQKMKEKIQEISAMINENDVKNKEIDLTPKKSEKVDQKKEECKINSKANLKQEIKKEINEGKNDEKICLNKVKVNTDVKENDEKCVKKVSQSNRNSVVKVDENITSKIETLSMNKNVKTKNEPSATKGNEVNTTKKENESKIFPNKENIATCKKDETKVNDKQDEKIKNETKMKEKEKKLKEEKNEINKKEEEILNKKFENVKEVEDTISKKHENVNETEKNDKIHQENEKNITENEIPKIKNTKNEIIKQNESSTENMNNDLSLKTKLRRIPDITITDSDISNKQITIVNSNNSYYPEAIRVIEHEQYTQPSDIQFRRNVVHQESKYQEQLSELKCEIEGKEAENAQLCEKLNELQRESVHQTWTIERLQSELSSSNVEIECIKKKCKKLEESLEKYKRENLELNEELLNKTSHNDELEKEEINKLKGEVSSLKNKIKENEENTEILIKEKNKIQSNLIDTETVKSNEISRLNQLLKELQQQNESKEFNFKEEYEKLRNVNSDRESKLLEDFEWKLREVQQSCKKKLEEKDKINDDKMNEMKKKNEEEMCSLNEQLKQLEQMKTLEAEVIQLRGLTHEQQRSLRMATRTTEQLQLNERTLNDEVARLRSSLEKERTHLATIQGIHSREISEKDRKHQFKMEQQKNELVSQWEDKLRCESTRLKLEMEKTYKEEKRTLVDETKARYEKEIKEKCDVLQKRLLESKSENERLIGDTARIEENNKEEVLRLQTNYDRDMLELRRKIDKLDMSYQEQIEKNTEKHEKEIELMKEECEKRITQNDQSWSQQVASARATLELVKEQLQREANDQIENLQREHQAQLGKQYDAVRLQNEEAIISLHEKYENEMNKLKCDYNEIINQEKFKENQIQERLKENEHQLQERQLQIEKLQKEIELIHRNTCDPRQRILNDVSSQNEGTCTFDIPHNTHAKPPRRKGKGRNKANKHFPNGHNVKHYSSSSL